MSRQERLQQACLPFQLGLSTRVGTEALARVLRVATKVSPRATVLSVDAAGAFGHVSRAAMLAALHMQPTLRLPLLPYAQQSDDHGCSHEVCQAEGGEQGDVHNSGMAKLFLPSWTTSTSLLHLSGSSNCMSTSKSPCDPGPPARGR